MRYRFIISAILLSAIIAACTPQEQFPANTTSGTYIRVSRSQLTKVSLTQEEDYTLTARWDEADSIAVIYRDATDALVCEKFLIDPATISGDGKWAVFSCLESGIPALAEATSFTILYPYTDVLEGDSYTLGIDAQSGALTDLGRCDVMSYTGTATALPTDITLAQHCVILQFPAGTMTAMGVTDTDATLQLIHLDGQAQMRTAFFADGREAVTGGGTDTVTVSGVALDEGRLVNDLFIAFGQDTTDRTQQFKLKVVSLEKEYDLTLPLRSFDKGRLYVVQTALEPVPGEYIVFADPQVGEICIAAGWDTNGDGHIQQAEAEAVTDSQLGQVFMGSKIESFDEFKYFTGITTLQGRAFSNCSTLVRITLPTSLTRMEYQAFASCASLPSIILPPAMESTGSAAFAGCKALRSLTVRSTSFTPGEAAFADCPALEELKTNDTSLRILDHFFLIDKDSKVTVNSFMSDSLTLTIPEGITDIGFDAFNRAKSLRRVVFPSSIASFGRYAFNGSKSLDTLKFMGYTAPKIDGTSFPEPYPTMIYVPYGAKDAFSAVFDWSGSQVLHQALLPAGPSFNSAIKKLSDPTALVSTMDTLVRRIVMRKDDFATEGTDISAEGSEIPVYASFDASSGVLSLTTPASEICTGQDASQMFALFNCLEGFDGLTALNTSEAVTMEAMFNQYGTDSLRQALTAIDLSGFNTAKVTNFRSMFNTCRKLQTLDLSSFDTGSALNFIMMFARCFDLKSVNLSSFNTASAASLYCMFYQCESLEAVDLSSFNTASVTDMSYMFSYCRSLKTLDLSSFNTANVTTMDNMFAHNTSRTSLKLGTGFNTAAVKTMRGMFQYNDRMESFAHSFDLSSCTSMAYMFAGCATLSSVDLTGLNPSQVKTMDCMFYHVPMLTDIKLNADFLRTDATTVWMFCNADDEAPLRTSSGVSSLIIRTTQDVANWLVQGDLRWINSGYRQSTATPVGFRDIVTGTDLTVTWRPD